MFGIIFEGHPCLQRLLMPHDWVGHPLLKSYPLQGDEYAQWYEIDRIFGKEYREIIGAEQRDSARIDSKIAKTLQKLILISLFKRKKRPHSSNPSRQTQN